MKSSLKKVQYSVQPDVMALPNLIEIQTKSYEEFLQTNILPEKRENVGLQTVFNEVFPLASYDENLVLEYMGYSLGVPKYDILECQRRGLTFAAPLKVHLRLRDHGNIKDETVYMGLMPLMTVTGTFIINGAERVIVSQLHRSPGICFENVVHPSGNILYSFRVIPYRGSWLEVMFDINDLLFIYIDRRKRRRKILATIFLRALGYGTNEEILDQFFARETVPLDARAGTFELIGRILARDVKDEKSGVIAARATEKVTKAILKKMEELGITSFELLKNATEESPIIKMLKKDPTDSQESALKDIYKKLRPGDPTTISNAKALIRRLFFDIKRYDLGRVGRYKLNQKLGLKITPEEIAVTTLKKEDILEAIRYLINLKKGEGKVDDIDHLGNRRVRSVGELL